MAPSSSDNSRHAGSLHKSPPKVPTEVLPEASAKAPNETPTDNASSALTSPAPRRESMLIFVFWMLSSMLIMQQAKAYFSDEVLRIFYAENFSASGMGSVFWYFMASFMAGMLLCVYLSRKVCHALVLCAGVLFGAIGYLIMLYAFAPLGALVFGASLGLIPAPSVCAIMEKISMDKKSGAVFVAAQLRPVGLYVIIPVAIASIVAIDSKEGLAIVVSLLAVVTAGLLLFTKSFGRSKSCFTAADIVRGVFGNGMFYLTGGLLLVASFLDVFIMYHLSSVIQAYFYDADAAQITAAVLLMLLWVRVFMVAFAELALSRIPGRRVLVFSGAAVGLALLMFKLPMDNSEEAKILWLFALSVSLSVVFPALIKSAAVYAPMRALPVFMTIIVIACSVVALLVDIYAFPAAARQNAEVQVYVIAGAAFIALTLLFFAASRLKKKATSDAA